MIHSSGIAIKFSLLLFTHISLSNLLCLRFISVFQYPTVKNISTFNVICLWLYRLKYIM